MSESAPSRPGGLVTQEAAVVTAEYQPQGINCTHSAERRKASAVPSLLGKRGHQQPRSRNKIMAATSRP